MEAFDPDFVVDGLGYRIVDSQKNYVEVGTAFSPGISVSKNVVVPITVQHGGKTYYVAGVNKFQTHANEIESIVLPKTAYYVGDFAFNYAKISSIDLTYVTQMGKYVLSFCANLTDFSKVKLYPMIQKIPYGCFSYSGLKGTVTIPTSVGKIENSAFLCCTGITSVMWQSIANPAVLDTAAFYGCTSLRSITLPMYLTKICNSALEGCTALKEITIPSNTTTIETDAFNKTGLTKIIVKASIPPTATSASFNGVDKSITVEIPKGTESLYRNAAGWKDFKCIAGGSALEEVSIDQIDLHKAQIYDISGRVVSYSSSLPSGTYIAIQGDRRANFLIP